MSDIGIQPQEKLLVWGSGSQARLILGTLAERSETYSLAQSALVYKTEDNQNISQELLITQNALKLSLPLITQFAVAVGAEFGFARVELHSRLEALGMRPISVISATASIDPSCRIGSGTTAFAGAIVQKYCEIGSQCIFNTGCVVDHECAIGDGVHIMGAAAIAGRVKIGDYATIGTNATILPDVTIGAGAYIGAGAVVTKSVPSLAIAVGVPARVIKKHELTPAYPAEHWFEQLTQADQK